MRHVPTFDELLDAALAAEAPSSDDAGLAMPPEAPYPFVYYRALRSLGTDLAAIRRHQPRPLAGAARGRDRQTIRQLTAAQREALCALNELGARLDPNFTLADLRRTFRSLARRCHPDAHHDAGPVERGHLARVFTTMHSQYQELLRAVREG